jgi:hypothetical protein
LQDDEYESKMVKPIDRYINTYDDDPVGKKVLKNFKK